MVTALNSSAGAKFSRLFIVHAVKKEIDATRLVNIIRLDLIPPLRSVFTRCGELQSLGRRIFCVKAKQTGINGLLLEGYPCTVIISDAMLRILALLLEPRWITDVQRHRILLGVGLRQLN